MDDRSQVFDQYKPRAMQSIKKAADGILYNLSHTSQTTRIPIQRSGSSQLADAKEPNKYVCVTKCMCIRVIEISSGI